MGVSQTRPEALQENPGPTPPFERVHVQIHVSYPYVSSSSLLQDLTGHDREDVPCPVPALPKGLRPGSRDMDRVDLGENPCSPQAQLGHKVVAPAFDIEISIEPELGHSIGRWFIISPFA